MDDVQRHGVEGCRFTNVKMKVTIGLDGANVCRFADVPDTTLTESPEDV